MSTKRKIIVSPSLLSSAFNYLDKEMKSIRESKATWVHYDVIDGHFAPNITFGAPVVKCLTSYGLFNDVHLMIENPIKYAKSFIDAGADLITFHYEASRDVIGDIEKIRKMKKGIKVGLSIKLNTPLNEVLPYVNYVDLILVMSVEPGFSGQKFDERAVKRVSELREYIDSYSLNTLIEVDGGVNDVTSIPLREAGVDVLVTGNYFFKSIDRAKAVRKLMGE